MELPGTIAENDEDEDSDDDRVEAINRWGRPVGSISKAQFYLLILIVIILVFFIIILPYFK